MVEGAVSVLLVTGGIFKTATLFKDTEFLLILYLVVCMYLSLKKCNSWGTRLTKKVVCVCN